MSEYLDKASGRVRVYDPETQSHRYRYRVVMEEHLGRPLREDEHVHHINGDPADDRIENLRVLPSGDHTRLHHPELAAARRAKRRFAWSRDYPACVVCGTDERPHFCLGKCKRCYHRDYMRARRAQVAA